jgi:nucleotide-binding universal stress UspA family protein
MFQSIVVAVDGSEPSKRALEAACSLARAFGSEVNLVHARESKRQQSGTAQETAAVLEAAVAQAEKAGVTPSSATAVEGDPFEEIMTIVGLYGADLVVTGRRGLGNISGLFAGSTSQQIAKNADCAHLSVK